MKSALLLISTILAAGVPLPASEPLTVPARTRHVGENGMEVRITPQQWAPERTALIVCDFWDSHHCVNAVKSDNEMAPRMAEIVQTARDKGVLIILAPSDCMKYYESHPARKRAMEAPP